MPPRSFSFSAGSATAPPVVKPWYEVQCRDLLLADKFQDRVFDKWKTSGGTWSAITQDVQTNNTGSDLLAFRGDSDWKNYFFECDVTIRGGSQAGIIGRRVDNNSYYQFMIQSGGSCFLQDSTGSNFASANVSIDVNTVYKLTFNASGSNIKCLVNYAPLINIFDSSYPSGNTGFKINAGSGTWDNVDVYDLQDVITPLTGSMIDLKINEAGRIRVSSLNMNLVNISGTKSDVWTVGKEVRGFIGHSGGSIGSLFTGTVERADPRLGNGDVLNINCRDYYYRTAKKTDVVVYENMSGGSIMTDLLNRNFPFIGTGSITYSGTGLPRYDVVYTPIQTVIADISENYDGGVFRIDENRMAIYTSGGNNLPDSNDFLLAGSNIITANFAQDTDNFFNNVIVVGGDQSIIDQSYLVSGGSTLITDAVSASGLFVPGFNSVNRLDFKTIFKTSGVGINVAVQRDSAGSPDGENLIFKVNGSDSIKDDDFTQFPFERKIFLTAGNSYWWLANCTSAGSHYLHSSGGSVVNKEYYGKGILAVSAESSSNVFGTSRDLVIKDGRIKEQTTAEKKADKLLEEHGKIRYNGRIKSPGSPTLRAATRVRVQIDSENVDDWFEIRDVSHIVSARGYLNDCSVDTKKMKVSATIKNHEDRLRSLETIQVNTDTNLIKSFVIPDDSFEFNADVLLRYDMTTIGSAFLLGHPINGRLGVVTGTQPVLGIGGGSFGSWDLI